MDFNITYRKKDNGIQVILSYKEGSKWKQRSKQGFEDSRNGKKLAKAWADESLQKLKENILLNTDEDYNNITFKEFTDLHIKHLELHVAYKTLEQYKYSSAAFSLIHDMPLEEITPVHIQNCVDSLIKKGLAEYTIKKYLDRVKALFNVAVKKYRIIHTSPVEDITIYGSKAPIEKKAFTCKELHDLVDSISISEYKLICILAGFCGLRLGEILGLTWSDVDFKNKKIKINKQWKINKSTKLYDFGELKTKNSYRIIPASDFVINELSHYENEIKIKNINGRIFTKDTNNVSCNMLRHLKLKGYNITIHELRHSFCTNLIARGLDFKTTASLMGDTVQEIMKTYSHVIVDMEEQAVLILNTF